MEEGNIANLGEAEKCRDIAKDALAKGDYAKAIKFFDKSLRLYPLPGVTALKAKAESLAAGGSSSSSGGQHSPKNPTSSSSTKSAFGEESTSTRSFTPEQEAGSKKILLLAKRSHYEVLGISKEVEGDQIKKAYRKLALKFHPDKNSAPSAEGAFKAISAAFDCLSDPKKRELYDQYGHDSDQVNSGSSGNGSGFSGFQQGSNMSDINPEDIFRMFFQSAGPGFQSQFGGGPGGGFHTFHFGGPGGGGAQFRRRRNHNNTQDDDSNQNNNTRGGAGGRGNQQQVPWFQQILQFLPFLLMLLSFTSFGSSNSYYSQPLYSLHPQGIYQIPRKTQAPSVSRDIPYYISDLNKFDRQYKPYSEALRKLEKEIEYEHKNYLTGMCKKEKEMKNNRIFRARFVGADESKKAREMSLPHCEEYDDRFVNRFSRAGSAAAKATTSPASSAATGAAAAKETTSPASSGAAAAKATTSPASSAATDAAAEKATPPPVSSGATGDAASNDTVTATGASQPKPPQKLK